MIYCIWYPSGGFGHYINAVLSLYGNNFKRPDNSLEFSNIGTSHSLNLIAPKYYMDQDYDFDFLPGINYSVLIDNGINNEGEKFIGVFPTANVIKVCYTDYSWPVIAETMIIKAMNRPLTHELDYSSWNSTEDWAKREKYFLFLRDHMLRYKWRNNLKCTNIDIEQLLDYDQFKSALEKSGVNLADFRLLWEDWSNSNFRYFNSILTAKHIINQIKNKQTSDLTSIVDIWTQAVVYYYIWLEFNVEIPHNDYSKFFSNTDEINKYLESTGVV